MAPILALPQETILEIAKALDIKEALALISTCKALHAITQARSFWLDQLRCLYEIFRPLVPRDLTSLSVEDLRAMAATPYRFEQTIMQGKLRQVPPVRLKNDLDTEFLDAKIVPGGRWIVTANIDRGDPLVPFVRLWRLVPESTPPNALPCIASKQLHIGYRPKEIFITAGEGPLDLLVLVNSFKPGFWEQGCYIHALMIDLAAEEPEFVALAELKLKKYCHRIRLQGDSVVGGLGFDADRDESHEFLLWDWKTGESRTLPSPGGRGSCWPWFTAASERARAIWDVADESIKVHWSDPPLGRDRLERHLLPPFADDQDSSEYLEWFGLIVREFWDRSGDRFQIALAHRSRETVWAKIEDCGEGRISFSMCRRNLGSNDDIPSELVLTASSHLLAISTSGLLTIYRTEDRESLTNLGESVSCHPFTGVDIYSRWSYHPFICPFSGIVGSISVDGDFHIWQQK